MPISLNGKTFKKFKDAENFVRKNMKGVDNPGAFVASVEQKQMKSRADFHKKHGKK